MRRPDALAWRDWARRRHSTHLVLKGVVLLVGAVLVVAGIAMLVLPGPGWAAIFLGLVVLGSEFDSAARVRHALPEKLRAGRVATGTPYAGGRGDLHGRDACGRGPGRAVGRRGSGDRRARGARAARTSRDVRARVAPWAHARRSLVPPAGVEPALTLV